MKLKKFLLFYYRSLLVFLLILIASTIPASEVEKVTFFSIPHFDKLVHMGMYFCFSFVLIYDILKSRPEFSTRKVYLFSSITAIIYGGSLEIIQGMIATSRTADIFDFLFNVIGALGAVIMWLLLKRPK